MMRLQMLVNQLTNAYGLGRLLAASPNGVAANIIGLALRTLAGKGLHKLVVQGLLNLAGQMPWGPILRKPKLSTVFKDWRLRN